MGLCDDFVGFSFFFCNYALFFFAGSSSDDNEEIEEEVEECETPFE